MSLTNQSARLGLERREEALEAITRAVEIYQTLAEQRPNVFAEDLENAHQLGEFLRRKPEE